MSKTYCMCLLQVAFEGTTNGTRRDRQSAQSEHAPEECESSGLVEEVVQVAALRALDAGGAAGFARAAGDQARGVVDPRLEDVEAALRDADAAHVAVVDEHRRAQRLRVQVRREAADVP